MILFIALAAFPFIACPIGVIVERIHGNHAFAAFCAEKAVR